MRFLDQDLRGRTVIGADGRAVGEISALIVDSEAWRVVAARVALRKDVADELGASRTLFHAGTIEIPARFIQSAGDAIVLSVAVSGLQEMQRGESEGASAH